MSTSYQLLINGTDLTAYVEQNQWSITQNWSRQGDTATFYLTDEHPDRDTLSFSVQPLTTVQFIDVGLGQTLFSGVCTKPQFTALGPNLARWQLSCVDWTYLSDRALVAGDYSTLTVDQLVILVTQQANCGITAVAASAGGFVYPGPQIPRVQFTFDTLTQAWTKLSKLASTLTTYGWYVDELLNLHFYPLADAVDSGITFTDDITAANSSTVVAYKNDDMAYEWDATSIRNSVTVRGADYSQSQTDLFVGNGSQTSFPLTYVPDAQNVTNSTLTVGGVPKTVSALTGDSATTDWVVTSNAAGQWFLATNTDAVPASPTIISFTYPYLQPVLSKVTDTTSVAAFQSLPNVGVFAYYIADTTLLDLSSATRRGQREVYTYADPVERMQVTTSEDFTGHVRAGQLVTFVNGMVPDSQNSYESGGLDAQFLVVQNQIQGVAGGYRTYQVTADRV